MPPDPSERPAPDPSPAASTSVLCPYCGAISGLAKKCDSCGGMFEPLSRQATQNAMGPWYIRDEQRPFRPGCAYETLVGLVRRGEVGAMSVIRGPTTKQFWTFAKRCPGVANLLGVCHACGGECQADDPACTRCGVAFPRPTDRQHLGLGGVHPVPRVRRG